MSYLGNSACLLMIYIPVYNGIGRIEKTLEFLLNAANSFIESGVVKVVVSDNNSTDETIDYCERKGLFVVKNDQNIGGPKNVVNGLAIDVGQKFTWIIGDDDLVLKAGFLRLMEVLTDIENNKLDVDYIHLNCGTLSNIDYGLQKFDVPVCENHLIRNTKFQIDTLCNFEDLVDVRVDDSILGAMPCSVFRSGLVRKVVNQLDLEDEGSFADYRDFSSKKCFPHTYAFSKAFNSKTQAIAIVGLASINTVGHQSWWPIRNKVISLGALDSLLVFFANGVVNQDVFMRVLGDYVNSRLDQLIDVALSDYALMNEKIVKSIFLGIALHRIR